MVVFMQLMPRRRSSRGERFIEAIGSLGLLIVVARVAFPKAIIVEVGVIACVFAVLAAGAFLWPKAAKSSLWSKSKSVNWGEPSRTAQPRPSVREQEFVLPRRPLPAPERSTPVVFTPELLSALEWRHFEILVTLYFQKTGFTARRRRAGADGGVDIEVSQPGSNEPYAYVQCKAWHAYTVGIKPVRELFGVMADEKMPLGFIVTTGEFTAEAVAFARGKSLKLVTGYDLIKDLNALPEPDRVTIFGEITANDYTTPTCPRCDVKMVERKGPKGLFWGCRHYPQCHCTLNMRKQ
jgi:restriction system protein